MSELGITTDQLNTIVKKLGGELSIGTAAPPRVVVWKTIKLRMFRSARRYCRAIKKAGMEIDGYGQSSVLPRTEISRIEMEVDIVMLSVAELGLREYSLYKDICDRGVEIGLELCPVEVCLVLCLAYKDQPSNKNFYIATGDVTDRHGHKVVFWVKNGHGIYGHLTSLYSHDTLFAFIRPRSRSLRLSNLI